MKVFCLLLLFFFNLGKYNANATLMNDVQIKLENVLKFVLERYKEFNFDGLFGIVFAEANLLKISNDSMDFSATMKYDYLIDMCRRIYEKILPLLPNDPPYMITFKNKLLNAEIWSKYVIVNKFFSNKIIELGVYDNWTAKTILENRRAVYKGTRTDTCLREILEFSMSNRTCFISDICHEIMLNQTRIDSGYLLTHRLLYMEIVRLQACFIPQHILGNFAYVRHICSLIFKEAKTNEMLGFPYLDIFLEQVLFCGNEGYEEFLNTEWIEETLRWQTPIGCYKSIKSDFQKRTSSVIDFGCSDHSTGLGAATLALQLRFLHNLKYNVN